MSRTILITILSSVVASVVTTVLVSDSLLSADAASSASAPVGGPVAVSGGGVEGILQGDVDCRDEVTPVDSLKVLRHDAGLSVQQDEPCPDIGTLAAIPGPTGPSGPQGPEGPAGITELELVISDSASDSDPKIWLVDCPEGKSVLGGGGRLRGNIDNVRITESNPIASLDAWIIAAAEFGAGQPSTWWIEVRAICATVAE